MKQHQPLQTSVRSEEYGTLQRLIDVLYRERKYIDRLDLVVQAEAHDLCSDLLEIVNLVPPGRYSRQRLCDQLNSSLSGHAWGMIYGTVE